MSPKKSTRDLSDLKARLGLAQPAAAPAPAPGPAPAEPAQAQPAASAAQMPGATAPSPSIAQPSQPIAPPGIVAPPGIAPPPTAAPEPAGPDLQRDPFAGAGKVPAEPVVQSIVDAGPAIEIPKEKKSPIKLIIALIVTAVIPLGVGWACGRIYGARVLFNKTIEDAGGIKAEVLKMAEINKKIATVLQTTRARNKNKVLYDEQLLEDLKNVLRNSPTASPAGAKKRQDKLFKTNYAMMEGIAVSRLFGYYNNTIRLMAELQLFIQRSNQGKELIKAYSDSAKQGNRKYGIVFAEDKGSYFLGTLVEVGNIVCAKEGQKECKQNDIGGFMVRTGISGAWSPRPGKPKKNVSEIVIPIIPDENWRQVAIGKRGYLAYKNYVMQYRRLAALSALLARDEKALVKDLGKASGREKVYTM